MRRILVVDDEKLVRWSLRNALEENGSISDTAASGEEAWEQFQLKPYEVVISDLKLPGMDGMELLTRVKGLSPKTKLILITAYGAPEVYERAKAMEIRVFDKPFDHQLIRDYLKEK